MDFRTVSLIPRASKILLKILTYRLKSKAEFCQGKDLYGFGKDMVLEINNSKVLCGL